MIKEKTLYKFTIPSFSVLLSHDLSNIPQKDFIQWLRDLIELNAGQILSQYLKQGNELEVIPNEFVSKEKEKNLKITKRSLTLEYFKDNSQGTINQILNWIKKVKRKILAPKQVNHALNDLIKDGFVCEIGKSPEVKSRNYTATALGMRYLTRSSISEEESPVIITQSNEAPSLVPPAPIVKEGEAPSLVPPAVIMKLVPPAPLIPTTPKSILESFPKKPDNEIENAIRRFFKTYLHATLDQLREWCSLRTERQLKNEDLIPALENLLTYKEIASPDKTNFSRGIISEHGRKVFIMPETPTGRFLHSFFSENDCGNLSKMVSHVNKHVENIFQTTKLPSFGQIQHILKQLFLSDLIIVKSPKGEQKILNPDFDQDIFCLSDLGKLRLTFEQKGNLSLNIKLNKKEKKASPTPPNGEKITEGKYQPPLDSIQLKKTYDLAKEQVLSFFNSHSEGDIDSIAGWVKEKFGINFNLAGDALLFLEQAGKIEWIYGKCYLKKENQNTPNHIK